MSKQINQYTKTRDRNSIQTEDLLDLDSTDDKGGAYESAKLSVSELSQYIANIFTFYRLDGSFPSGETRTVNFNSGKLRFEAGGDVELRGIGLSDYGFIVQNLNNLQRAKLGTDDSLDTGILSLSDANGEFLNASEGKVGIGVSSPTAKLQVKGSGSTSATTNLLLENSNGDDLVKVLDDGRVGVGLKSSFLSSAMQVRGGNSLDFNFLVTSSSNLPSLKVGSDKKTALGNGHNLTDPINANLHVACVSGVAGLFEAKSVNIDSVVNVITNIDSKNSILELENSTGNQLKLYSYGSTYSTFPQFQDKQAIRYSTDLLFNNGNVNNAIITSDGKVGIGTSSPSAKIHVKGQGATSATSSLLLQNSVGDDLLKVADDGVADLKKELNISDSTPNIGSKLNLKYNGFSSARLEGSSNGILQLYNSSGTRDVYLLGSFQGYYRPPIVFGGTPNDLTTPIAAKVIIRGDGSSNPLHIQSSDGLNTLSFLNSGNLGLGTASPTAKLHVKGQGSTSATSSLLLQNSIGDDLLKVTDDGQVDSKEGYWLDGVKWGHTGEGSLNNFIGGTSGQNTTSGSLGNTGLGYDSLAFLTTGDYNTGIGYNVLRGVTTNSNNIGIGVTVMNLLTGDSNIGIGNDNSTSLVSGDGNVIIGKNSGALLTGGSNNVFIGRNTGALTFGSYSNSISIGQYSLVTSSNQMVVGDNAAPINEFYLGKGVSQLNLSGEFTLRTTSIRDGATDEDGDYNFVIAGSQGTGTGKGGDIIFKTAPSGVSGSTQNPLVTSMTIKESGILNIANLPTSSAGLSTGDIWNDAGTLKIV